MHASPSSPAETTSPTIGIVSGALLVGCGGGGNVDISNLLCSGVTSGTGLLVVGTTLDVGRTTPAKIFSSGRRIVPFQPFDLAYFMNDRSVTEFALGSVSNDLNFCASSLRVGTFLPCGTVSAFHVIDSQIGNATSAGYSSANAAPN